MKLESNWKNKSIQTLEKKNWGEPNYDSYLVKRCFQLSKIPLIDFTIEDLRLMIGQNFSLSYLIPLAIEVLNENILAEGDFYPGGLLKAVISVDPSFWLTNQGLYRQIKQAINGKESEIESERISLEAFKSIAI